ncbi:islet cell autoantigen 1 [Neocloeon triangulifer]|uniref:islet cell autoantigen 1 n=1 Tax=Neocloeon triangulifer TaxID=2078957 RepID=UPI00286EEA5E|nr:islet cell autoantigen 1 [Neocloeon triangulifer]
MNSQVNRRMQQDYGQHGGFDHPLLSNSTISKMQKQFWVTKQTVFKKLGKKEDECVVASDSDLDAKLELYRSIQQSCYDLQRIIERYQEKTCTLSQEENAMGRFLKEAGKVDKSQAGKMMILVGKAMSYTGQQRLSMRMPLLRLHQEVDTFRRRAIDDTNQNIMAMERSRTEYRASLNWMKEVSQQLDPDTNRQMEKFRKVQIQVRTSKQGFDKQKIVCLQKVDLLAAARCNMFSHALILYQSSLLKFAEMACKAFSNVAKTIKDYQPYEFNVVKELRDESLKLAEETEGGLEEVGEEAQEALDKTENEMFLFGDDFKEFQRAKPIDDDEALLDIGASSTCADQSPTTEALLKDLFAPDESATASGFSAEWQAAFGNQPDVSQESSLLTGLNFDNYLPSKMLENWPKDGTPEELAPLCPETPSSETSKDKSRLPKKSKMSSNDMSAWLNVFSELDPLANPDSMNSSRVSGDDC